jgi:hypothetical protein
VSVGRRLIRYASPSSSTTNVRVSSELESVASSLELAGGTDVIACILATGDLRAADQLISAIGLDLALTVHRLRGLVWREYNRFPLLEDETLELAGLPGAFVVGAAAQLSIGPAARSIKGIGFAADRIASRLVSSP